ncbi:hypothetical protein [Desulfonema magnum]|uniref:Uncharacterized protein n=1 Tax=Desulfonema magnum TaxID=45655 RepID=A0A975BRR0_9BACT|nr:hypothetical protein [Desulfonema magnum]QTA90502.1 Uncharacterized protein dnm_065630 [Desulfonema magnum]
MLKFGISISKYRAIPGKFTLIYHLFPQFTTKTFDSAMQNIIKFLYKTSEVSAPKTSVREFETENTKEERK